MKEFLMKAAMIIGASTIGGLLGYGSYGYFHEKKKMSSWKAGAATGALTGGLSLGMLLLMGTAASKNMFGAVAHQTLSASQMRRKMPRAYRQSPLRTMGTLVVSQLRGCGSCA